MTSTPSSPPTELPLLISDREAIEQLTLDQALHNWTDYQYTVWLLRDGRLIVRVDKTKNHYQCTWYADQQTKKPWLVQKRKNFVSLVKQMVKDGDFDELT